MIVPFFSHQLTPISEKEEVFSSIIKVVESGIFIGGESVELFEREFATINQSQYAVAVSNGLDALRLSLVALNLTSGKRVGVPAHTFIATWLAIIQVGAIPVGIDVDEEGLIGIDFLEKIAQTLDGLMVVHMHGKMPNMLRISDICAREGIELVEDCSQAHFAQFEGVYSGNFGKVSAFSLYPTKNIGALGDAGVIVTKNEEVAKHLHSLRSYGSDPEDKYLHRHIGFNNRMDTIQASVLRARLRHAHSYNNHRRNLALTYYENLSWNNFKPLQSFSEESAFHHFCLLTSRRDELRKFLERKGVGTEIHYPRVAPYEISDIFNQPRNVFEMAHKIAEQTLSLPLSQWHTKEQIDYVITSVNVFFEK